MYDNLRCPMAGCREPLHLAWEMTYVFSLRDVDLSLGAELLPDPEDAHTASWKVQCLAGHVVLLPDPRLGCPCPDEQQDGPECPHRNATYDWSEETRVFREPDLDRLRTVLGLPCGAS
jgi:hypothetical protein